MQRQNEIEKVAKTQVSVRVVLDQAVGQRPNTAAYVFDCSCRYIAHAPLDEQGTAIVPVPVIPTTRSLYVLVGPDISLFKKTIGYTDVKRLCAVEKQVIRQPVEDNISVRFQVYAPTWQRWFLQFVSVRGTVIRWGKAGKWDRPIAGGVVHVYEAVSLPRVLSYLPPALLERIKQELLDPPAIFRPFSTSLPLDQLQTARNAALRDLLVANAILIRPFLSYWDFLWPFWHDPRLLADIRLEPDNQGQFEGSIFGTWHPDDLDTPDLYFTFEQAIGGVRTLLYIPHPIPCYTYWDYRGEHAALVVIDRPRDEGGDISTLNLTSATMYHRVQYCEAECSVPLA